MQKREHLGANNLLGSIPQNLFDRRICVDIISLNINGPNPLVRSFNNRTELFFAIFHRVFRDFARGDVARSALYANWFTSATNQSATKLQRKSPSRFGYDLGLIDSRGFVAFELARQVLPYVLKMIGRHNLGDVHRERFRLAITCQPLTGLIQGGEIAGKIDRVDDIVGILKQLTIAFLAFNDGSLRLLL